MSKVRVRFAPSPTGGLHLGGVRTALFNYLFAKQHKGDFILRVEDTDQTRFVPGAEEYIMECLKWCGIEPDESPAKEGAYGPYRQSERKAIYKEYADKLIKDGKAYYAFDTPDEIEAMRERLKVKGSHSLQYDYNARGNMKNSISLSEEETKKLLDAGTPHVIRIKVNPDEHYDFEDMIRGEVKFDTNNVDDKVLLKADGMPTYHLAVVVDDYLMKISHVFRGEEWLPSAPVHILLWKYLFGLDAMPKWAHLPLILKPDGNGKLSKRDGDRLGFPVYAMDWKDAAGEVKGFKEIGFLPEAFINLLAVLGWNDGTEQEIFSMEELIEKFSTDRVHKGGAKFDYEKAKWFNHEWIKKEEVEKYSETIKSIYQNNGINITDNTYFLSVLKLIQNRCFLLPDFFEQGKFFYTGPIEWDADAIKAKWNESKTEFFNSLIEKYENMVGWNAAGIENEFKNLANEKNIKAGELQLPMRIMLVGGKYGPGIFSIAEFIGRNETTYRIKKGLQVFKS